MHGHHPEMVVGGSGIFTTFTGLLLVKHTHVMPIHCDGLQKRLSLLLNVLIVVFPLCNISSKCIKLMKHVLLFGVFNILFFLLTF